MSSTNRGSERIALDAYYTDIRVARATVRALHHDCFISKSFTRVLEPSAGKGAWVQAISEEIKPKFLDVVDLQFPHGSRLLMYELCTSVCEQDFLSYKSPYPEGYQLILGNPPFGPACDHVEHAYSLLSRGGRLVFLLRSAFVESTKRAAFWAKHPLEHEYRLVERPSFTGGGNDSCAYSVFVWRKPSVQRLSVRSRIAKGWTCSRLSWKGAS